MSRESQNIRLAIPTEGDSGLDDVVSDVFGRSKTFTLIDLRAGSVENIEILESPAASYKHGAGPIAIKTLKEKGVNAVAAQEFGVGASSLLDENEMEKYRVEAGTPVREALLKILEERTVSNTHNI